MNPVGPWAGDDRREASAFEAGSARLFQRALRGEATPRPPIWLMRQAGRTDPEYCRLKREAGLPLEALFRHPEWAARLSLLPRRIGVDALIYFQDILTPLGPLGAPFRFAPGPLIEAPLRTTDDLDRLALYDVEAELPFITETFRLIRREVEGVLPVLGFAGAPFTLAVFLLEGGSFAESAPRTQACYETAPTVFHRLLNKLTRMTVDYLRLQMAAGADAVQLFESAAFLLAPERYEQFALPYQQQVFAELKGAVPTIHFARDWRNLELLKAAGADVVSLPSDVTIGQARAVLGRDAVVQGNLSNRMLRDGDLDRIAAAAEACIKDGGCRGHVFNLDHGLLRDTPFEHVTHLVQTVRSWNRAALGATEAPSPPG